MMAFCVYGQQRGIQISAGFAYAENTDILMTPDTKAHTGIFIGLTSRLRPSKRFSIYGSVKYVDLEFIAHGSEDYFTRTETMKWTKFRLGGVFKIIEINKSSNIRLQAAIPLNLLLSFPDDLVNAPYDRFNPFTTGVAFGVGADLWGITIDFEYEIGVLDQITNVSESTFNYWDLGVGVMF